jgi:23S rRNA (cytidine2498-2'-O)-methyltransferase
VNQELCIVTAQAEFSNAALYELRQLDKNPKTVATLAPDITLCSTSNARTLMRLAAEQHPIFVRHLAPVQTVVDLANTEQDIGTLALAIANLSTFDLLERGQRFAVQTRFVQTEESKVERPYSSGRLNQLLAEAIAEETAAVESIKKPQVVVSLLCTAEKAYLGISTAQENLSTWPGGARHFAQTPEQISRAEFKLLEALELFGLSLPEGGRALDLGAAPGGWTRLLLEAGMSVVAVDPAKLDPRLQGQARLQHYRGYAETYLEDAVKKHRSFDVITNDMRVDAREAARLLVQAGRCLRADGFILSTLKLPHITPEIDPLKNLREALNLLSKHFRIVRAHQLFHNRQEVTVVTAQPFLHEDKLTFSRR